MGLTEPSPLAKIGLKLPVLNLIFEPVFRLQFHGRVQFVHLILSNHQISKICFASSFTESVLVHLHALLFLNDLSSLYLYPSTIIPALPLFVVYLSTSIFVYFRYWACFVIYSTIILWVDFSRKIVLVECNEGELILVRWI